MSLVLGLVIGLVVGAAAGWLMAQARAAVELARVRSELEVERRSFDERTANAIKAIASDALRSSNTSFLELAETKLQGTVAPLRESLQRIDTPQFPCNSASITVTVPVPPPGSRPASRAPRHPAHGHARRNGPSGNAAVTPSS